jgi:type VI secretion system secreted protein Hcp
LGFVSDFEFRISDFVLHRARYRISTQEHAGNGLADLKPKKPKRRTLMASDMFIKIGSKIKGESKDQKHKEEIDVLSWSWGAQNSGSAHQGGGAGAGKVNVQDLNFTKWVDKSTPDLILACCNGQHFDDAKLVVRKAGGSPLEYLVIEMNEVMVTSVNTGGSPGEDRLTENVVLNFAKVKLDYLEQGPKGEKIAGPFTMGWDIPANKNV